MKISIIGAGSWGTALAEVLVFNKHEVLIYDVDENTVDEINNQHTNVTKLPNAKLSSSIVATSRLEDALDFSEIIVLSVPTKVIRAVLKEINKKLDHPALFINTSKGLEPGTFKRVSEVVKDEIDSTKRKGFVAITGPSHAEEVILKMPTLVTSASLERDNALLVQKLFSNNVFFRVYTIKDLVGAELGGALKNIYALAAGMLEGLGYGDNAKAALISRALVEMKRLAVANGALEETLTGLTGLGDLVVTTTSYHSRNFQAGIKLAKGKNLDETISSMTMVVEGVRTALSAYQKAHEENIDVPIIDAVYSVIYEKQSVSKAVESMMMRALKDEFA